MQKLVALAVAAPSTKDGQDDAFTDRLSSRYTIVILIMAAVLVSAATYVGSPIICWTPKHFTGSHTKFTDSYCWVRSTYYLSWEEHGPPPAHGPRDMVLYYQWVPFILLGQAILFYLPKALWNGLNQKVGVDADDILEAAQTFSSASKLERKKRLLDAIVNQFHRSLTAKAGRYYGEWRCNMREMLVKIFNPCGNKYGNYLATLYLISKVLYIANVIGQLFLLNSVLSTNYNIYGIQVWNYMWAGHVWDKAPDVAFPRVTFCDLKARRLGNVQPYTVQCLLPINMYNEKIYMFLWFWFVVVAALSVLDFFTWLARYISRHDKITFIQNHLLEEEETLKNEVALFVDTYLKQDGVFLLRLISHNTNHTATTDVVRALWQCWLDYSHAEPSLDETGSGRGEGSPTPDDKRTLCPSLSLLHEPSAHADGETEHDSAV